MIRPLLKFALAAIFIVMFALSSAAREVSITFLLVNDIDKMEGSGGRGGFARLNAVVKAERAKGGHVIYAHAGDMISPSLVSGFDKGEHTILLTNMASPDAFTPGNHEYDFGPDVFLKRMQEAKFPLLAANLRDAEGKLVAGFADTRVVEIEGLRIGIVGLTNDEAYETSSPGNLKLGPAVETGIARAKELREGGADFLVAVTHSNRSQDRALFDSRAFDLILSGHDQDLLVNYDGKTAMAESYEQADYVTAIDVKLDVKEDGGKKEITWTPDFRIIDTVTVTPDPETQAKIDEYRQELAKELDVVIGKTSTPLDTRRATVRTGEAAFGNLIADAVREAVKADIGIMNGGNIRGNKEYSAGSSISRKDVLTELPFGNRTVKIEISGETLRAALENGVSQTEKGAGRFPQVSSLAFAFDPAKPAGGRVSDITVGGKPLDPQAKYTLATNEFLAAGGDGYAMFLGAKTLYGERDAKLSANDVMVYIRERGEIGPKIEGRIVKK